MEIKADELRVGDMLDWDKVVKITPFYSEVSNQSRAVTDMPKLEGMLLHARAAQEAVEHSYVHAMTSLSVVFQSGAVKSFRPDDILTVMRSMPAAA